MTLPHFYWRLFWQHRWWYALFTCLQATRSGLALLPPFIARTFFDALSGRAATAPAAAGILGLAALSLAVELGNAVAFVAHGGVNGITSVSAQGLVQANLLRRILTRPGARALPGSTGEALTVLREDVAAVEGFLITRAVVPGMIGYAVVACATMLRTDAVITAAMLLPLALIFAAAHLATPRVAAARRSALEATGKVTGAITRTFGAVQAVKVANAEAHVIAHLRRLNDARHGAGVRDRVLEQVMGAAFASTTSLGAGLVLLLAGRAMRAGTFTVGDYAMFAGYYGFLAAASPSRRTARRRRPTVWSGWRRSAFVSRTPAVVAGSGTSASGCAEGL
jgi:ATP-binding cassette subfamily B protein